MYLSKLLKKEKSEIMCVNVPFKLQTDVYLGFLKKYKLFRLYLIQQTGPRGENHYAAASI